MESVGLAVAFGAGVLSFLSPCVLPLVPSYLTFVTGMSLEDLQGGVDRRTTLVHSLLFVGGFTTIFLILGASASFLGQFLRVYETWIARVGGVVIIILGLHLAGAFRLGVGAAFGAGWTPCIGPVLGAILTLAASSDRFWTGVALLFVYSMGLAVPFLLSALALDRFLQGFKRFRRFLPAVQVASGVLLVAVGLLLVTGTFTILSGYLIQFTPEFILERI
jgi:cytochrome c-type biogenesis protein